MYGLLIYSALPVALILLVVFAIQGYKGGIMNVLRVFYVLAIMSFLIMLVVFGISAFYETPEPSQLGSYTLEAEEYYRNVFCIAYPCGLLFVLLGLLLRPRLDIFRVGLIMGGIGTIIYAIAQPHMAGEIRFTGVACGLIVLLLVGYKTLLNSKPATEE